MVRGFVTRLVLIASTLWAGGAAAQQVTFGVATDLDWNSNLTAVQQNEVDAFRTLIGPRVRIEDPYGRLTYALDYIGQYSWYIEPWISEANNWEQTLRGAVSYAISRRTQLTITDTFDDLSSVRFDFDDPLDSLDAGFNKFKRNGADLELTHMFDRRLQGSLMVRHDLLDYDQDATQSDSTSVSTYGQLEYSVTRADRVGIGGGYAYQTFDGEAGVPGSTGQVANGSVSWNHTFTDDFRFSLAAGPSWIESDSDPTVQDSAIRRNPADPTQALDYVASGCGLTESSCGAVFAPGPPITVASFPISGGSDSDLTFFARASVVYDWEDFDVRFNYTRRQSNAAGDAGTSTMDRVQLRVTYDPNRPWDVYGLIAWNRRQRATRRTEVVDYVIVNNGGFAERVAAITDLGGKSGRINDQISLVLGASRDFSPQLRSRFEFRYRHQVQRRQNQPDSSVDVFILNFRVDYSFAPIKLW